MVAVSIRSTAVASTTTLSCDSSAAHSELLSAAASLTLQLAPRAMMDGAGGAVDVSAASIDGSDVVSATLGCSFESMVVVACSIESAAALGCSDESAAAAGGSCEIGASSAAASSCVRRFRPATV